MKHVLDILPGRISYMLEKMSSDVLNSITQIRLRINRPILVYVGKQEYMLCQNGLIRTDGELFTSDDLDCLLRRLNEHSPYIHDQSIKNGYITIKGGHRIGIGGEVVYKDGEIKHISNQTFFCIRCAHQIKGCFEVLRSDIFQNDIRSCLFFSPPGDGKTTMLRDCCRVLSSEGYNVALIDERNEISGSYNGIPSMDLGNRCDVLSNCPRSDGILSAIRALAPDIIITDELGFKNDADAVSNAMNSGIIVIASIHADSIEQLKSKELLKNVSFDRYVHLRIAQNGLMCRVFDRDFLPIRNRGVGRCCI